MKFKVGDKIRVVNCYSGGNFDDGDIVKVAQIGCDDDPDVYGAYSPHDNMMWFLCEDEVGPVECPVCAGYEHVFFHDADNESYLSKDGEMVVVVDGKRVSIYLNYCPVCGRPFK